VANHFPAMSAMAVINVEYGIEVTSLTGNHNVTRAGSLAMVNYSFGRGTNPDGTVALDYSGFDQDAEEAAMAEVIQALAAAWAAPGALGVDVATVLAAIAVTRTWTFTTAAPVVGTNFGIGTVTESFTVPPPPPANAQPPAT
jgi:hypothetical protein